MIDFTFPSIGPFVPPSGPWMTGLACVQCFMVLVNGLNEVYNPTPYSKFAKVSAKLPSRVGMTLIYTPSFLVATVLIVLHENIANTLASYLVALHFLKRVLECLFLHKYSGSMELSASVMISTFYTLISILLLTTAQPMTNSHAQTLGLQLFAVGELGNLYHHYLLRQLRSEKGKKRYVAPHGGLFDYVAAPHYLFEITAFLGIAYASQSLHALLAALGMASYLTGRAVLTNKFYQDTFDKSEWSRDKKAIIPFVF